MRISEVLAGKSSTDVVTVQPGATVRELLAMLAEHNIGALVVSENGTSVDGIVSERDVVRGLHSDEQVLDAAVSTIMTANVATCEGHDRVNDLMVVMTEGRFRHIPVVKDGELTGIVSIGDVVKHRMSELEFERDQLDHYVQGT